MPITADSKKHVLNTYHLAVLGVIMGRASTAFIAGHMAGYEEI